jgi:hypothetical protein
MKPARVVAILLAVLLVASLVARYLQPSAVEVARAWCVEQGLREEDVAVTGYRGSGHLFGETETVSVLVRGADPPRRLRINLRRPVYFLGWEVVGHEVDGEGP